MPFPVQEHYDGPPDREAALAWLDERREAVEGALAREGAVCLRGLPLVDAGDFDALVRRFRLPNFPYRASLSNAVRVECTERVFTANEAPPEASIRLHHELAQTPRYPSRLYFFCERAPDRGGETALCRSDRLFETLLREREDFARDCEEHGLVYHLVMPPDDDAGSGQGRSWRRTFGCDTREEAEQRMQQLGYAWEWQEGDCLRASTPVLPAVRRLPDGRRSFFNQLVATLGWSDARNAGGRAVSLGDGRPLDAEALAHAARLAEGLAVDWAWRPGDVALVDNLAVLHGRRPFRGTRRVLASLAGDPEVSMTNLAGRDG